MEAQVRQPTLVEFLVQQSIRYTWIDFDQSILFLPDISLYIQWISPLNVLAQEVEYARRISDCYASNKKTLWRIWEDQWLRHFDVISGRLNALLGRYIPVHARKCVLTRVDKPTAKAFLENNHLLGYASARYAIGLLYQEELVALTCFSNPRKIIRMGKAYRSAELIRYACKCNYLVSGGLSKMIRAYLRNVVPDDLVTYTDSDYAFGSGFERLGFQFVKDLAPNSFYLDSESNRIYLKQKRNNLCECSDLVNHETPVFYTSGGRKWIFFPTLGAK